MYLAVLVTAGALFIFCSYWVYHYIDPSLEESEDDEVDAEEHGTDMQHLRLPISYGEGGAAVTVMQHRGYVTHEGVENFRSRQLSSCSMRE
jgi:hypothetical protein